MYKLTGVTKDYPRVLIEDGEWLAIQGPTGHGKRRGQLTFRVQA